MRSIIPALRENLFYILFFGLLGAGLVVLRTTATPIASLAELDALLQAGKPSLIELYSNT